MYSRYTNRHYLYLYLSAVMWSETVGLSYDKTGLKPKKIGLGLGLAGLMLVCGVKHGLVTIIVMMILEDTATFKVLFIVSLLCAWNITTVEINSGVYLLKS